ncbi:hypothetical protein [Actinoplanes aureus]|uniref:Metallo-beta-lactamase domain-containing protein n=1 Tax=Actinoplanes aureus TaxID=2792083 RepID=A0A931G1D0_9ACTN|nr:hypothetical protein [Actinoplanes aureus]MBG0566577.1 hypothetical protein [Actinoplanes aureus]
MPTTDPQLYMGVERIDIALGHFHLDHVVGLSYLDALDPAVERHVWGPGAWLYGRDTRAIVEQLTGTRSSWREPRPCCTKLGLGVDLRCWPAQ